MDDHCRDAREVFAVMCHARLMWLADPEKGGGAGRMSMVEQHVVLMALCRVLSGPGPDQHWRVNASLDGCRLEPEVLDAVERKLMSYRRARPQAT